MTVKEGKSKEEAARTLDAGRNLRKLRKLKRWKLEELEKDSKNPSFPLFIEDRQRTHLHGLKQAFPHLSRRFNPKVLIEKIQRSRSNQRANERAQGSEVVCPFRSHPSVRVNLAESKKDYLEKVAKET
ncbi:hypothetical protein A2U01_0005224 [Trifolium medium]|uniref:Uncharacterized protein n=1 Tax=Trifolium medium TaxID=97028 RepID=A0A392MA92_9FABA|nr:hypothetical protein [Trifolium medium]